MSIPIEKQEEMELWRQFKEDDSFAARQQLIIRYLPQVKYQVGRIKMYLPEFIEESDLESYDVIGLIDAIYKFDYKKGIKFNTYASRRIRGEIIDYLRRLDWLPHTVRREGRIVKNAVEQFTSKYGRRPSINELARALNMSEERIENLYSLLYSSQWFSLHEVLGDTQLFEFIQDKEENQPEEMYQKKRSEELLAEAIDNLNDTERLVISLYYYEGLTQKEIAEIMDLSPARVSQLHKKAIYRLRGSLARKKEQLI